MWDSQRAPDTQSGDPRAVASLVGYLLVFAIVLGGAVVLSTVGLGLVLESGNGDERHLQRFESLDSAVADLSDGGPYRELEVDSHDASVSYGSSYTIRITASGGGTNLTGSNAIEATGRTVRYEPGPDRVLAYEAGLIADEQANGTRPVVRGAPDIDTAGSRAVLVLPTTSKSPRSSTLVSAGVRGTVPVVLERTGADSSKHSATDAGGNPVQMTARITVEGGDVPAGWGAYFADKSAFEPVDLDGDGGREYVADTDGDGESDIAGASFRTTSLYVRTVSVAVALGETL